MKRIKVTEVSSDTNIGGAGKCLLTLLKEIDRTSFDVGAVIPKNSLLKPHIEALGVPVIETEGMADRSLDRRDIGELRRIFKEQKPDIVHTHASMSARIAARQTGAKVVYTRHSVFPPPAKISRGIGKLINGALNNYLADSIIAVAEAAKDNLTDTGIDPEKITVILNGVDGLKPKTGAEKAAAKKRFGIEDGEKVISIIARLEDIKGHEYFIDAADILLKRGVRARFMIAGTGSYESALKAKAKSMGLEKSVVFTGFIPDVDALLAVTDLQANASYGTEATSLALLEGMSLGIPAVVSDFGGNPGVISDGENGLVVPKQNAQALAEGLYRLIADEKLYSRMSEGAKRIFSERFTSQSMTRQTENVYKKLMNVR